MLNQNRLKQHLENNSAFHNKLIYGDPVYECTNVFCCPYKGCSLNEPQKNLNKAMSAVRGSLGWYYGEATKYYSFPDYKHHQHVATTPTATSYKLGVFVTNCVTIAHGRNNNSKYFRCPPPMFEKYFASCT
ncbi:Hypothetical protein PHPALM_4141 [Phytophthora palmivora]|uniref:DDE Tnp4 domain-containing protein n=1 Tax=Phytophthora palmivora TaxID=4796 RepID=A0A2P4YKK6_9STRA|nr:Hypothetical protein PHPALM_4141 [Phytophthora palmivora]